MQEREKLRRAFLGLLLAIIAGGVIWTLAIAAVALWHVSIADPSRWQNALGIVATVLFLFGAGYEIRRLLFARRQRLGEEARPDRDANCP